MFIAAYFMVTAKHSIQEVLDAAAIQAGSKINNPDIKEYEGDNLSWRLQATSAQEQSNIVVLIEPKIDLYTEKREVIPIQSLTGEYNRKKEWMHFEGQVQAKYQGWTLNSEQLDYDKTREEIKINVAFVMFQKGMVITGKDMRIFKQSGRVQVLQGVKMKIEEKP